ncbi:MAG: hypothetical protein ABIN36_08865 [Ferruginibacter sp.]
MLKNTFCCFILIAILSSVVFSQDTSRLYFTTSIGLLSPVSSFANAYKTSLALSSGIEYRFSRSLFSQFVLDFNAVKYDQQLKDERSDYLFQNTNSSIFLAGINVGRNFSFGRKSPFFLSFYTGAGYVNIGEPRLIVKTASNIIEQEVRRMTGVFAKGGLRFGCKTSSKILQTIYFDCSYWMTNLKIQQARAAAFSLYIGTRFGF